MENEKKKREGEDESVQAGEKAWVRGKETDVIFHGRRLNLPSRQSLAEDLALCDRQYSVLALFSSTHLIHYYATLTHWQEPGAD